jgi:Flp pilus assembly protein CpaB
MASTTHSGDTVTDRRRTREDRGIRSTRTTKSAVSDRLPAPPRQRRPALAALAVLLIVGGAAVAALLAMRVDERVPVLVAEKPIAAGQQITEDALGTTDVASEGTLLIPESQLSQVVGQYASRSIEPDQLIDTAMLQTSGMLTEGSVAVGASLAAGRMPASGLFAGDVVDLISVDADGKGRVIVENARVSSTGAPASTDSPAGAASIITVIVERDDAPEVAAANAGGQLSVVLVSRGTDLGTED